jgi:hypothetical protein
VQTLQSHVLDESSSDDDDVVDEAFVADVVVEVVADSELDDDDKRLASRREDEPIIGLKSLSIAVNTTLGAHLTTGHSRWSALDT